MFKVHTFGLSKKSGFLSMLWPKNWNWFIYDINSSFLIDCWFISAFSFIIFQNKVLFRFEMIRLHTGVGKRFQIQIRRLKDMSPNHNPKVFRIQFQSQNLNQILNNPKKSQEKSTPIPNFWNWDCDPMRLGSKCPTPNTKYWTLWNFNLSVILNVFFFERYDLLAQRKFEKANFRA